MRALVRFLASGPSLLGLVLVGLFVAAAIAAPTLAPDDGAPDAPPGLQHAAGVISRAPGPPRSGAPLGTLPGGWDVYFTLIWGTRAALGFGLGVAAGAAVLGTIVGLLSGYAGGWVHKLSLAVVDGFLTFPALAGFFLIERVISSISEAVPQPPGILQIEVSSSDPLMLTLILFSWMPYARIISSNALRLKQVGYVEASRALGARWTRVVFHHILPNVISPAFVLAARDVGGMVILSAAFTFIGVGSSSPWGLLITIGRDWIIGPAGNPFIYWWTYVPATLALLVFGISWNLVGDGLADLLLVRQQVVGEVAIGAREGRRGWAVPVSAVALGIVLGILWSWWADPPRPSGVGADALREDQRVEYLRMAIEAFGQDLDIDQAMRRYQNLGRHAEATLRSMRTMFANPPQTHVRQFLMVEEQVASFYPLETSAAPPSLREALLLLIPSGALVVFILSAPTAVRQLAGRRPGHRPALGRPPAASSRH